MSGLSAKRKHHMNRSRTECCADDHRVRAIEQWFARTARALPWRDALRGHPGGDGYVALVAELMLQQTQVDRVVPRFQTFMHRFPTVDALAAADEAAVLAAWQGLGYYRRARSLRAAAQEIVARGGMPQTVEGLRSLPGLGRYSAGSIASIAFGVRAPIVDGNVARVVMRWSAHPGTADGARNWCWSRAERLVARADLPGRLNEGLMELGALVCTPRRPKCAACPVRSNCAAAALAEPAAIPAPRVRPERTAVHHHAVVVRRRDRVLLEQRPGQGLWARLWQVPTVEAPERLGAETVTDALPFRVTRLEPVTSFEFLTTHRAVQFHVFTATTRARRGHWLTADELEALPMAAAQRQVIDRARRPVST